MGRPGSHLIKHPPNMLPYCISMSSTAFSPTQPRLATMTKGSQRQRKGAKTSPQTSAEDQRFLAKFELMAKRIWGNAPSAASRSGDDVILQRMIRKLAS